MRNALAAVCVFTTVALMPRPAAAWGYAGHKFIMRHAIELLPPELKPLFDSMADDVVSHVIDPDLWRNVGWEDDPNHFLDFGSKEYGAYPFDALPRDYDKALEKFGRDTLKRNGELPWRLAEEFGNLRRTFEEFRRGSPYTTSDIMLFSAVLSHYVQDAHQPFHATDNYDGRETGNDGIHSRFERDLIERFASRLTLTPAAPQPVTNPRDMAFATLLNSYQQVDSILAADTAAAAGRDTYDDAYFEAFFAKVKPVLERQLSAAISMTAGAIIGAWEAAGRPAVRLTDDRTPQRIRR